MPKATRKKKIKAQDFQKPKLKVGKKKALPDHHTETAFRSQAVNLPSQSIVQDKTSQATDARKHTLGELTSQLKHYSASVRRDAIAGLKDLLKRHPHLLHQVVSATIQPMARLLVDDDPSVRKALLGWMKDTLPLLTPDELRPHLHILLAYTRSAMTHLYEDIRVDSLNFLNLWIQAAPTFIAQATDKHELLLNYLRLLDAQVASSTHGGNEEKGKAGSQPSGEKRTMRLDGKRDIGQMRVLVMQSLFYFLEASRLSGKAYADVSSSILPPMDAYVDGHTRAGDSVAEVTVWDRETGCGLAILNAPASLLPRDAAIAYRTIEGLYGSRGDIEQVDEKGEGAPAASSTSFTAAELTPALLYNHLRPTLLAVWLESAADVFDGKGDTSAVEALALVIQLLRTLSRNRPPLPAGPARKQEERETHLMMQHLSLHFPYGSQDLGQGKRGHSEKAKALLQEANVTFCELAAATVQGMSGTATAVGREKEMPKWAGRVVGYILSLLRGEEDEEDEDEEIEDKTPLLNHAYLSALLPAIWTLLQGLPSEAEQADLLAALIQYAEETRVTSPSRLLCVSFLSWVISTQAHPQYRGSFRIIWGGGRVVGEVLSRWILSLPKLLWRYGATHANTGLIIRAVSQALRFFLAQGGGDGLTTSLQLGFTPYFHYTIPAKGSLFGPFLQLEEANQRTVLEALWWLGPPIDKLHRAIMTCIEDNSCPAATARLGTDLLRLVQQQ